MSLAYVKSLLKMDESEDCIAFEGKCHDCQDDVNIVITLVDGDISVYGGAFWRELDRNYVKCQKCFEATPYLTNYRPTEVYSRVCGYLRPVKQWNIGKQEEFKERTMFKFREENEDGCKEKEKEGL